MGVVSEGDIQWPLHLSTMLYREAKRWEVDRWIWEVERKAVACLGRTEAGSWDDMDQGDPYLSTACNLLNNSNRDSGTAVTKQDSYVRCCLTTPLLSNGIAYPN